MQLDLKAIGWKIRQERQKLGISRGKLAEMLGVSEYYIGQLERGERVMSLPVFAKLASILRVSPDYLLAECLPQTVWSVQDPQGSYDLSPVSCDAELLDLLCHCTPQELEMVKGIVKLILAYTPSFSHR